MSPRRIPRDGGPRSVDLGPSIKPIYHRAQYLSLNRFDPDFYDFATTISVFIVAKKPPIISTPDFDSFFDRLPSPPLLIYPPPPPG